MKNCNNPVFKGVCYTSNKETCCRYCSYVKSCLKNKKENSCLCGYVKSEKDLSKQCPFET